MPELPEMETYRKNLLSLVATRKIKDVIVNRHKSVNVDPGIFIQSTKDKTIKTVYRRGKHLLFLLDSEQILLLHLMLGGWLFYGARDDEKINTAQIVFSFGDNLLYFNDLRLGYLHLYDLQGLEAELGDLGPEPFDPAFTEKEFRAILQKKGKSVLKTVLVDQHFLAGIGNCYSDEIVFAAGILPTRKISSLLSIEMTKLYHSMKRVLEEATEYGGYMEHPLFEGDTVTGGMNEHCQVYDRGGEPCYRCGTPITKETLNSRKVFYCEGCQV
ncbi:DNA-formamidopyrimidine glycosylase [Brevibacillus sp. SYSU BS000544]|uniref:DNA-formamidopyrimidine glycosylase n=1 Tax=Brevibacillus sp. SYSU BS000544 TaxID=3416443 RepID=UPI003CE4A7C4